MFKKPDEYYLTECYKLARDSRDPGTQNGAVVVNEHGRIIGAGYNRFARGQRGILLETPDRLADRDEKLLRTVHAETAAIFDAARQGNSCVGATMYGAWVACAGCALDIIESGIVEVVGHKHRHMSDRPEWNVGIEKAFDMLREAGVKIRHVDTFMNAELTFGGKVVRV